MSEKKLHNRDHSTGRSDIRRSLLLLICLSVLASAADAQPGKRKDAPQSKHLYPVYRYGDIYQRKSGFIDNTGKLVIDLDRLPETTSDVREFHEGRAVIYLTQKAADGKTFAYVVGYLDESGQIIIAPRFNYARDFSEGLAYVERQGFHGFIDRQGKPVINLAQLAKDFQVEAESLQARDFHEGLAAVGTGRWGGMPGDNDNSAQRRGLWGYIDHSGKLVIKPAYQFADYFSEGLAGVVINGYYGFINHAGQLVIQPRFIPRPGGPHGFGIGGTGYFAEGLACVQDASTSLYGYIDMTGNFRIPPKFYQAMNFNEGLAWALHRDGKAGWIDKSGQWVITEVKGVEFSPFGPLQFSEGLAPFPVAATAKGTYLWGFMDHNGVEVIKPVFSNPSIFVGGLAFVIFYEKPATQEGRTIGYIDKTGQFIWKSK